MECGQCVIRPTTVMVCVKSSATGGCIIMGTSPIIITPTTMPAKYQDQVCKEPSCTVVDQMVTGR